MPQRVLGSGTRLPRFDASRISLARARSQARSISLGLSSLRARGRDQLYTLLRQRPTSPPPSPPKPLRTSSLGREAASLLACLALDAVPYAVVSRAPRYVGKSRIIRKSSWPAYRRLVSSKCGLSSRDCRSFVLGLSEVKTRCKCRRAIRYVCLK